MKESCPTCKFYEDWDGNNMSHPESIGCCHRYPRITQNSNGKCFYVDVNDKSDWCGEWIRKEEFFNEF
jgi:hypothetical protein